MKGIVFSEFLEFVEQCYSSDTVDDIINTADLPSEGAYTTVATYDHNELLQLIFALSDITQTPVSELVRTFGQHLFTRLSSIYPHFAEDAESSFDFLERIDKHIHVEVRKLYPDAELPKFDYEFPKPGQMVMIYSSTRPLADLAEGLISGCIEYFQDNVAIKREDLSQGETNITRFTLTRQS